MARVVGSAGLRGSILGGSTIHLHGAFLKILFKPTGGLRRQRVGCIGLSITPPPHHPAAGEAVSQKQAEHAEELYFTYLYNVTAESREA